MLKDSGCGAIVKLYVCETEICCASVTLMVKLKVPLGPSGVPLSVPFASMVSPAGSALRAPHV